MSTADYETMMHEKKKAAVIAAGHEDVAHELHQVRQRLERAQKELRIAHAWIKEQDQWSAFVGWDWTEALPELWAKTRWG